MGIGAKGPLFATGTEAITWDSYQILFLPDIYNDPRRPYEFGVKVSLVVAYKHGLMVDARMFSGNPYNDHTLAKQKEQTTTLLQDIDVKPSTAVVDLGFRSMDAKVKPAQSLNK